MNIMFSRTRIAIISIIVVIFVISACTPAQPLTTEPTQTPTTVEMEEEEEAPAEPTVTNTPEPTATPTQEPEPAIEALPADTQKIDFTAADGQELTGFYYPAAVNPAPTIILMHWAPGDQRDWMVIGYWLQNRGLLETVGEIAATVQGPWLDPSWFPEMPADWSFNVFSFTFRQCDGGCSNFLPDGWLLDAQAAFETVRGLEGVDPDQIISIGASIGADGAPDGCLYYNETYGSGCLGAIALSPGSYLTLNYAEVVNSLEGFDPQVPNWCFYSDGDTDSAAACQSASGSIYQTFEYSGTLHGMDLIGPEIDPDVLVKIQEFIQMTFGLE